MLITGGFLLVGVVLLCRLFKSERTRTWSLPLLAVALGFGVLALPGVGVVAEVLAGHLVQAARRAVEQATPFVILAGVFGLLLWASRRGWLIYLGCSPGRRGMVLLSTVALGVATAALVRIAPYLPDAARVAKEGARAGWAATVQAALDAAASTVAEERRREVRSRPDISGRSERETARRVEHELEVVTMKLEELGDEVLLLPSEVAGLFHVDVKTVGRWAKAGKLSSIRTLGGHRRHQAGELRAVLVRVEATSSR